MDNRGPTPASSLSLLPHLLIAFKEWRLRVKAQPSLTERTIQAPHLIIKWLLPWIINNKCFSSKEQGSAAHRGSRELPGPWKVLAALLCSAVTLIFHTGFVRHPYNIAFECCNSAPAEQSVCRFDSKRNILRVWPQITKTLHYVYWHFNWIFCRKWTFFCHD